MSPWADGFCGSLGARMSESPGHGVTALPNPGKGLVLCAGDCR